jgi:hypothetical protein
LYAHFGLTAARVADAVRRLLRDQAAGAPA